MKQDICAFSFFLRPFRCIGAFLTLCFPLTPVRHPDSVMYELYLDRFHNLPFPFTYKDLVEHKQALSPIDETRPQLDHKAPVMG